FERLAQGARLRLRCAAALAGADLVELVAFRPIRGTHRIPADVHATFRAAWAGHGMEVLHDARDRADQRAQRLQRILGDTYAQPAVIVHAPGRRSWMEWGIALRGHAAR